MAALLWLLAFVGLLDCTQSASAVDWSSAPAIHLASGQLRLQQATVRVVRLSGFCTYRVALKTNDTPLHAAWGVSSEWELLTRTANSTRCEVGPVHTSEHSVQHSSDETALFLIGPPHQADHGILDVRLQGTPSGCSDGSAVLPSLAQTVAVQLQLDSPASIHPLHHSGNTLGPVIDWARSQGAQLPKLVPAASGGLRGLWALHDIGAKEVFLSIPRKQYLQVVEGESTPNPVPHLVSNRVWRLMGGGHYADLPGQLPFLLMSEMLKGTGSFWHAYIQHLPSHHNLLVRWSTRELAALQDAALVSEAMLQKTLLEEAYQIIQDEPIVQKYGITLDQFVWATCQRMSRAFNLPPRAGPLGLNPWAVAAGLFPLVIMLRIPLVQQHWRHSRQAHDVCRVLLVLTMGWSLVQQRLQASQVLAFAPLSDALNHKLYVEGEIRAAPFSNAIKLVAGADGIKAGSEVYISYGELSNQMFLQFYGFTIPDSPEEAVILYLLDTEVELKMEGIGGEVLQGLRMQYATEEQMEEAAAFKPKRWLWEAVQNSELPSVAGVFKTARLWEAVQNFELPSVAGFFKTARFNSLEQKIAQVLLDACTTELNSKPTTLGQDMNLLRKAAPAEHSRAWLALQYRIGQKQVLQNCIEEQGLRYDTLRASPWLL